MRVGDKLKSPPPPVSPERAANKPAPPPPPKAPTENPPNLGKHVDTQA
jgi:hypothetical protein